MRRVASLVLVAAAAGAAWLYRDELRYAATVVVPASPHAQYAAAIQSRDLDDTELGRAWLQAARTALQDPSSARPPFTVEGEFDEGERAVASWRFAARRGQRITADVVFEAGDLFVDLFEADPGVLQEGDDEQLEHQKPVASAGPGTPRLTYEIDRDAEFVLRLQPELLRRGAYELRQHLAASLLFPVEDVSPKAVRGVFGDARDGGRRRHEGIDIFAPRGTPAVAATDGWITGGETNRLGGTVVWLWSPSRSVTLYYAHLDRRAVSRGQRVRAGEIVGYVGTTGNARGTSPHLHFGIYASGDGAVDPLPYVCDAPCPASP